MTTKPTPQILKGMPMHGKKKSLTDLDISIIEALKRDHDDLKAFIQVLKDEDVAYGEKKEAYALFSDLLKSHAKSEEKAFYDPCLKKSDLRTDSFEGYEEHAVADSLMKKIAVTKIKDQWLARTKVLAELVEHHIEEEEEEFFPKAKKEFKKDSQEDMAEEFVTLRQRSQKGMTDENAGILSQV